MKKLNVIICGGDEKEAWLHARACRRLEQVAVAGIFCDDAVRSEARAKSLGMKAYKNYEEISADRSVDAVELLFPLANRTERALAALNAGKHVLVGTPFAENADDAGKMSIAAKGAGTLLMSYENRLLYPPMVKMKSLVVKKSVGRVTALRMRTLIAGRGGWDNYLTPDFTPSETPAKSDSRAELFREIYEKLSVAFNLLGPIEEIFFINKLGGGLSDAGSAVLTWKHSAHGTYGALDICVAPDMEIRSAYDSRDDNMEVTGAEGIMWMTLSCSQMRKEPTIRVYRGENQFAYGNLDDDWLSGYMACAGKFADCALAHSRAPLDPAAAARVVKYVEAAFESAEKSERVSLREGA